MANLLEMMASIEYDPNWQIWADSTDGETTNARYGQAEFEQGGMLDECNILIGNGEQIGDHISNYCEGFEDCPEGDSGDWAMEAAQDFLSDLDAAN